jgi:hypothetical protein
MRLLRSLVRVSRAAQLFLAAAVTLPSVACSTGPRFQPLGVKDVVLAPNVRVGKNLYATERTQFAVEAGASWVSGSEPTTLSSPARIGGADFSPPETIRVDVDLSVYDASIRWRHVLKSIPIGFELGTGFAYLDLNMEATSSGLHGAESVSSPGARFSAGAIWRITPTTDIAATTTAFGTSKVGIKRVDTYDIMLERTFKDRFVLRGGYVDWNLDAPSSTRSSVDLKLRGPSVGFRAQF